MAALSNPGQYVGTVNSFPTYPDPHEILRDGGVPGMQYLYVLAKNVTRAQSQGWAQLAGVPFFDVAGEAMTLLGRGERISAARPGTVRCRFFLDDEAFNKIGHGLVDTATAKSAKSK